MERFLVTGGSGFIGSNIVKELLNKQHFVRVLDNFSTGKRENLLEFKNNPNFELIEGDLRSFHIVRKAIQSEGGVDYVLHQGALPSVPRSIKDTITTNDVNILGTLNVLEASRETNVKRVVYASSSSVYGNSKLLPKVEDMPICPLSPYALSKYTAERYCQIYSNLYGLETICLRYFNVFGIRQDPTSEYSAVIPKFINLIKEGISPVIFGDGTQSRDFTYVDNVVHANILACYEKGISGEVFNIACGARYSLITLVQQINQILGTKIEPTFSSERTGDVLHSQASIEKAKTILNYSVKVDFTDGLIKTVANYYNL